MCPSHRTGSGSSGAQGVARATGGGVAAGGAGLSTAAGTSGGPRGETPSAHPRRRVDRLDAAVTDQEGRCFWCGRAFCALVPPTTDHVVPRVKGGPSWRENEVAACRRCNGERGHLGPVDWLEECLRRGWPADAGRLSATLARLDTVITERGGQRRARPYLDGQRRRLRRGAG